MANQTNNTKVVTGKVRLSYCHLLKPAAVSDADDADKKYSVSIIIPKSDKDTLKKINAAIEAAKEAGKVSKFGGKVPANLKTPLRDGDTEREDDEAYADSYFINCTSSSKPGVVDRACNAIIDESEIYSGCYGRVSINFYAYNASGNKGIAAGLNNVQKLAEGEPLGSKASAESDFADAFEDDDEDF